MIRVVDSSNLTGILNINKPKGITSHDVVNEVRKRLKLRKVGHSGTLDPLATGVLLVCVGQATRLIEYLMFGQKEYEAVIRLGQATDTYDADGMIVAEHDPSLITQVDIQAILGRFQGAIIQYPPPFSAIKKDGVPLYKLARQGKSVPLEPRQVKIDSIKILNCDLPELTLGVTCQAGTYIRSIAHDLGEILGVGAHVTELKRVASGAWHLNQAISLATLAKAVQNDEVETILYPMSKAVAHLPALTLSVEQEQAIGMGQRIQIKLFKTEVPLKDTEVIAGYSISGELVAILVYQTDGFLKPKKVFKPFQPKTVSLL